MKTKTKITMLLGLLLVLAGFVIALLFGWEWPDPYGGAELGVWYAGDIAHIVVDSGSAEVRVYDTDGSRIEVTADGWADSFSAFAADGQLYVTYDGRGGLFRRLKNWGQDPAVILWVPDSYDGGLTVSGGSGDVGLHGAVLRGGAELSVDSGTLSVYDSRAESLTLRSGSGDIFLGDVKLMGGLALTSGSGLLFAEDVRGVTDGMACSSSGCVQLQDIAAGTLTVRTDSGDIWLEELDVQSLCLTTGSGDVNARLTGDMADYSIHASTDHGSSNLPREFASGQRILEIDAGSGDINVTFG